MSDSGEYIVARADSIRKYAAGSPPVEAVKYQGRFGLLSVDGDFKKVTPILWQELLNNEYIDASPVLSRFGDVCWIVARTRRGNEYKEYFYLATYPLSSMNGKVTNKR